MLFWLVKSREVVCQIVLRMKGLIVSELDCSFGQSHFGGLPSYDLEHCWWFSNKNCGSELRLSLYSLDSKGRPLDVRFCVSSMYYYYVCCLTEYRDSLFWFWLLTHCSNFCSWSCTLVSYCRSTIFWWSMQAVKSPAILKTIWIISSLPIQALVSLPLLLWNQNRYCILSFRNVWSKISCLFGLNLIMLSSTSIQILCFMASVIR